MVVDWILRSTNESQKTVNQFSYVFSNDENGWSSQQLRGSLWFTVVQTRSTLSSKVLSSDIRLHRIYPKVAIILKMEPFTWTG